MDSELLPPQGSSSELLHVPWCKPDWIGFAGNQRKTRCEGLESHSWPLLLQAVDDSFFASGRRRLLQAHTRTYTQRWVISRWFRHAGNMCNSFPAPMFAHKQATCWMQMTTTLHDCSILFMPRSYFMLFLFWVGCGGGERVCGEVPSTLPMRPGALLQHPLAGQWSMQLEQTTQFCLKELHLTLTTRYIIKFY